MSLDFERLHDAIINKIDNDADGKYTSGTLKPDTSSQELEAWTHYLAKAIVEEFDLNANTAPGIDVEDSNGNKIGETRQSDDGVID